jgi:hypothetical protein
MPVPPPISGGLGAERVGALFSKVLAEEKGAGFAEVEELIGKLSKASGDSGEGDDEDEEDGGDRCSCWCVTRW